VARSLGHGGTLDVKMEHDHGPWNGRAEIDGTIADVSGAVVPGATVTMRLLPDGEARTAHSDAEGRFTLAALTQGKYRMEIASPGFERLSSELTLQARDRARVSATLNVGAVTEAVTVAEEPMPAPMMMARAGAVGGPMGGLAFAAGKAQAQFVAADNMALESREIQDLKKDSGSAGTGNAHVRSYFPGCERFDSNCRFDYDLADGDAGFDGGWRAGHGNGEPEGVSGFFCRPGFAGYVDAGRSRVDSCCGL
jgi:hypothetical protein